VIGLAIMGDGYMSEADTVADSLYPAAPILTDSETGFRCVTTA
jgi:hypothetical protein